MEWALSRLTLEQAYRGLTSEKRDEVKNYIAVIVDGADAPDAWEWMKNRIPDWGQGTSYEENFGSSDSPAVFHFVQEDSILAMEFKLMWGQR